MSDYRDNIYEVQARMAERFRQAAADDDDMGEFDLVYSAELFRSTMEGRSDRCFVEFLLGGGGPTTWVRIDPDGEVEFHHSWGMDEAGNDLTRIVVLGPDRATWADLAERWAECA